jgi:hypothetical protein
MRLAYWSRKVCDRTDRRGKDCLVAVEVHLKNAVDRLAEDGEFIEGGFEQVPLQGTVDGRFEDNQSGM